MMNLGSEMIQVRIWTPSTHGASELWSLMGDTALLGIWGLADVLSSHPPSPAWQSPSLVLFSPWLWWQ